MSHIFRYVSVVSAATSKQSAASTPAGSHNPACETGCNYADNYYGDQLCLAKPRN